MPSGNQFTTASILAFISLGLIRGSFSVVIHFADVTYHSPSLVFLLRTPGTVVLYVCLLIFLTRKDSDLNHIFLGNLRNVHNYWKSAVMGFLQLAAPYLLFMYGLKVMSPTAGGVFMAAAPWTTVMLERLPFIRQRSSLSTVKILAMVIGFTGVIMVCSSDVMMAINTREECENWLNITNTAAMPMNRTNTSAIVGNKCRKFTTLHIVMSLLALAGGCLMWSVSSVFWRSYRGDIHFVVAGVWNNLFAGIYALIFWFGMRRYEHIDKVDWRNPDADGISSIIFLTVFSGWIAALIVDYMYRNVGATATNRVLCLVPLFTWIEDWIFVRRLKALDDSTLVVTEVIGLVLVFSGLVTFSLEFEGFQSSLQTPLLSPTMDEVEVNNSAGFTDGYRETDDGATSEEEVENGSQANSNQLFPPLMEVKASVGT